MILTIYVSSHYIFVHAHTYHDICWYWCLREDKNDIKHVFPCLFRRFLGVTFNDMFKMPQILISTICIQVSVLLRTDSSPQSTACSPKPMCVRKYTMILTIHLQRHAWERGFWPCFYFVRLSYVKLIPHVWPNRNLKILTPIAFPQKAEGQMTRRITTTDCVAVRRFLGFAGWFFFWRPHLYWGHLTVESVFFTSMPST